MATIRTWRGDWDEMGEGDVLVFAGSSPDMPAGIPSGAPRLAEVRIEKGYRGKIGEAERPAWWRRLWRRIRR